MFIRRLPPAFGDVPTDADYAVELVAHRVAAGLDIDRLGTQKHGKRAMGSEMIRVADQASGSNVHQQEKLVQGVNWKKWAQRAVVAKTWIDDGRHLMAPPITSSAAHTQASSDIVRPSTTSDNHTYPAHHSSGPGLVTLTSTSLLFTPLLSAKPQFNIPLTRVRSVKKIGFIKGLIINAASEDKEMEEIFKWIGDRDELFARLVGSKGIRFLKA